MAKFLLDYLFPITAIEPTPAASTAFLKQVLVVGNALSGGEGTITECSDMDEVEAIMSATSSLEIQQLFDAGMTKVFVLPSATLDIADYLEDYDAEFFTILISKDFADAAVTATNATGVITISSYANLVSGTDDSVTIEGVVFTAQTGAATLGTTTFQAATSNDATAASLAAQINGHPATAARVSAAAVGAVVTLTAVATGSAGNDIDLTYTDNDVNVGIVLSGLSAGKLSGGDGLFVGTFDGVIGLCSTDDAFLATHAIIANRCAFHTTTTNRGKNMFYAFGKLLSNSLNWRNQQYIAMPLADDIINTGDAVALFDDRISFVASDSEFSNRLGFFAAGGKAITAPYIKRNLQVDMQSAALTYISANQPAYSKTQAALLEDELQKVIQDFIDDEWIEAGTVSVELEEDNFVASGEINISEPKALWRIVGEMRQTL